MAKKKKSKVWTAKDEREFWKAYFQDYGQNIDHDEFKRQMAMKYCQLNEITDEEFANRRPSA